MNMRLMKYVLVILIAAQLCMPAQAMWHSYFNTAWNTCKQQTQSLWQHAKENPVFKYTTIALGAGAFGYAGYRGYKLYLISQKNYNTQLKDLANVELKDAVKNGYSESVQTLLEKGAQVDQKDNDGMTPLMYAAEYGRSDIVQLLIQHGAQVNQQDKSGCTPVMSATMHGHSDIVKTLLDKGVPVNQENSIGVTLLATAALFGHIDIVRLLLQRDATNINQQDILGRTALICAAMRGHSTIVQLLLQYGADPSIQTKQAKNALDHADQNNDTLIKILMAYSILQAQRQGKLHAFMQKYRGSNAELDELYARNGEQGILGFCYKTLGITSNKKQNIFLALQHHELGMHKR